MIRRRFSPILMWRVLSSIFKENIIIQISGAEIHKDEGITQRQPSEFSIVSA